MNKADRAGLTEEYRYAGTSFRFDILRLWQRPTAELLSGNLGLLPLAVLGQLPAGRPRTDAIPEAVLNIAARVERELSPSAAETMFETAVIFAGMYIARATMFELLQRIDPDRETPGHQVLYDFSMCIGFRRAVLLQGTERFGPPTNAQKEKLDAIKDVDKLNRLLLRVLKAKSWDALLRGR